jgi:hypothetical protein
MVEHSPWPTASDALEETVSTTGSSSLEHLSPRNDRMFRTERVSLHAFSIAVLSELADVNIVSVSYRLMLHLRCDIHAPQMSDL